MIEALATAGASKQEAVLRGALGHFDERTRRNAFKRSDGFGGYWNPPNALSVAMVELGEAFGTRAELVRIAADYTAASSDLIAFCEAERARLDEDERLGWLIETLIRRFDGTSEDAPTRLAAIPNPYRALYFAAYAEFEIYNGGVHQYFANSSGRFAPMAVEAFETIGPAPTGGHDRDGPRASNSMSSRPSATCDTLPLSWPKRRDCKFGLQSRLKIWPHPLPPGAGHPMLQESVEEYKETCAQIRDLNSSIMTYSSAAVTASGSLFAAIAGIRFGLENTSAIPVLLLVLAVLTLFIQITINYKCASHNRTAAYRAILASERLDKSFIESLRKSTEHIGKDQKRSDPAVSYDVCVDKLNYTYATGLFDFNIVRGPFFSRKGVFKGLTGIHDIDLFVSESFPRKVKLVGAKDVIYGKTRHEDDVWKRLAVPYLVFVLMLGFHRKKGTWAFPDYINRMICFIVMIEIATACVLFRNTALHASYGTYHLISFWALLIVSIILLHRVSVMWQDLMIGGKRIFSYFVQFVPFRMIYIRQMFDIDEAGDFNDAPQDVSYFIGAEWEFDHKDPT